MTENAFKHLNEVMEYFHENLSLSSASKKINDLIEKAESLNTMPSRGQREFGLVDANKTHRYLLFRYTTRKTIKVIYHVDSVKNIVYVTDFFPSEMNPKKLIKRNR